MPADARHPAPAIPSAGEALPLVYDQLRAVARQRMALERSAGAGHTLQPTALVHEAFARLARHQDRAGPLWKDQREFFLAASREMERVLVDHARAKFAVKRGGDHARASRHLPLDVIDLAREAESDVAVALREAILRLEEQDPQAAAVVRLRFFVGLSGAETAEALGISERTAVREWAFARAWLAERLKPGDSGEAGA